jgi:MFS/sugar transport protein
MAGVGLYIRLGILETQIFARLVEEKRIERTPVLEVIRRQPKEIVLCALAKTAETAPGYIYIAFVFVYGTQVLHASREFLLSGLIASCGLAFFVIPFSGYLSDRIGRKRMYIIGAVAIGIFGFIYFALLNSLVPALMFLAVMLSFVPHGLIFGPQAALFAECFTPRLRYSGTSIGFHLAAITGGGPAPLIATAACLDRIGLRDRRLHRRDRRHQYRGDAADARSHQQGHLARARLRRDRRRRVSAHIIDNI